jgi:hydroxymethylbilane synthase
VEGRADDELVREAVASLNDPDTLVTLLAERAVVTELGATCRTPVGAHASLRGDGGLVVRAFVGLADGSVWARDELAGSATEPVKLGREVAHRLLAAGAEALLAEAEAV